MDKARTAGLVEAPVDFARNSLVMISQFDLNLRFAARPDARRAQARDLRRGAVPCGRYTRMALQKMSADPKFWPNYGDQVLHNVATQEQNVEGVVQKVVVGDADAGFVYATDAILKGGVKLVSVPLPDEDQDNRHLSDRGL